MAILMLIVGYLFGSISSAIVVCRALGHADPRTVGSNNPGATNVLRAFGKAPAALTMLGDVAKGIVPIVIARYFELGDVAIAAAGLGAFLGHLYPVFFGFVGGKGVATLIGALLAYKIFLGGAFMLTWITIALITRYSSLSALTATLLAPAFAYAFDLGTPIVIAVVVMAAFVFWRHRSNISNLRHGREDKIGAKRSASSG